MMATNLIKICKNCGKNLNLEYEGQYEGHEAIFNGLCLVCAIIELGRLVREKKARVLVIDQYPS